jgi:hypothetical protein
MDRSEGVKEWRVGKRSEKIEDGGSTMQDRRGVY